MKRNVIILILFLTFCSGVLGTNLVAGESKVQHVERDTNGEGVEFEATFYSDLSVELVVRNATQSQFDRGFSVRVEGTKVESNEINSDDSYEQSWNFDLYESQDPKSENQEIEISFSGGKLDYTYDQTPTANDADEVQMAQLSAIDLQQNATGDGVKLLITIEDESIHSYAKTITVHTEQTPKAIARPTDFDDGTDTVTVELNEDPGDTVRGEIRLFTGHSDEMNDSLDMVEFEGSTDEPTDVYERDYEPVEERGFYQYGDDEDESSEIGVANDDGSLSETAISLGILAVGGLVTLLLFGIGTYRRLT